MTTSVGSGISAPQAPAEAAPPKRTSTRTPRLIAAMTAVAVVGTAAWTVLHLGQESTDDAQIEGRVLNVSARVPGQVARVHVQDNQTVNEGDVLVELDPADYLAKADAARADLAASRAAAAAARASLALTQKTATANLVQARGALTSATSSMASARATIAHDKATISAAESQRVLADIEWRRSRSLLDQGAIPQSELDARKARLDLANATVDEARARLVAAEAALSGSNGGLALADGRLQGAQTLDEQLAAAQAASDLADARVSQMEFTLKLAELNVSYTTLRATRRGVVSRRSVEEGQIVSPERPLFAIVPLDDVWVVANFKEDQLAKMNVGSKASISVDTFPGRTLLAHVDSIAGGTGARFALLPPDNATGNFVKVVQRIQVLLRIDDPAGLTLRPGMSADVTVDTRTR